VRIERGNGLSAIERAPAGSQQVVFLDPPFESPELYLPALRAASRAIAPGGVIYLEAGRRFGEEELAPLGPEVVRHLKAGAVHAHLLRLASEATA
jgi:16S rRNA G966 N2-methylase RsmD